MIGNICPRLVAMCQKRHCCACSVTCSAIKQLIFAPRECPMSNSLLVSQKGARRLSLLHSSMAYKHTASTSVQLC